MELSGLVFNILPNILLGKSADPRARRVNFWVMSIIKNRVMVPPGGNPASACMEPWPGIHEEAILQKERWVVLLNGFTPAQD